MAGLIPPGLKIPTGIDPIRFYLQLPAMAPEQIPPGADRTMTTDGPDQMWFVVVAVTCIAVPAIFLMLRIYTRLVIVRSLEIADYFLLTAFPLIVLEVFMGYKMVYWGAGVHQWQVTMDQLFHQLYWANTAQVIYCPLSFLVKMSILVQYLQLFAPSRSNNKIMWYGSWMTIISTFAAYTVFMFWTLFYCSPRRMIWFKLTPGGKCHDVNDIILAQGAFNMASDIVILLLPTISLWRLNVPTMKKVFITLMFGTGLLACVASGMRILFTLKIAPVISQADVSHNGLFIGLWTEAEVALAFIVSSSLCLPRLFQAKGKKIRSALSYASPSFGGLSSFASRTRKSLQIHSSQKSTQHGSRSSRHIKQSVVEGRPTYYEDRVELQKQAQAKLHPEKHSHDLYVIPSTAGNSEYSESRYSRSVGSRRSSGDNFSIVQMALVARQQYPRTVSVTTRTQDVPLRLDPEAMPLEKLEEERKILEQFDFNSFRVTIDTVQRRQTV